MKSENMTLFEDRIKTVTEKLKPWGRELWLSWTGRYAGKILELKKGHRYSLQYHRRKMETQYVLSGLVEVTYGPLNKKTGMPGRLRTKRLKPGDKFHVPPYTVHRAKGLLKSRIFEVSTADLDDVVKLHDDYGRSGSGNNETLDRKLSRRIKK